MAKETGSQTATLASVVRCPSGSYEAGAITASKAAFGPIGRTKLACMGTTATVGIASSGATRKGHGPSTTSVTSGANEASREVGRRTCSGSIVFTSLARKALDATSNGPSPVTGDGTVEALGASPTSIEGTASRRSRT